jgi:uncharacterized protein
VDTRLRAAIIGLGGGIASGLLGIGGGVIMVPLLVMLLGIPQRSAHAVSLASIAPIAVVAVTVYVARGEVWWAAAGLIAAGTVLGAPLGVKILARAPENALQGAFGIVALLAGIRLLVA